MGGIQRNSEKNGLLVGDKGVTLSTGRGADGDHRKPPTKERMSGVGDFYLGVFFFNWVVEGGINLMDRNTLLYHLQ